MIFEPPDHHFLGGFSFATSLGNITMARRGRKSILWLFGISALLSFGKASAQNSNTRATLTWPSAKEFLSDINADSAARKHIHTDTLLLNDTSPFLDMAEFDQKKDIINLHYLELGPELKSKKNLLSRDATLYGLELANLAKFESHIKNAGLLLPVSYAHEEKHRQNFHNVSKIAFGSEQLLEFHFYDEITARVAELLYRRDFYLKSRNLPAAFTGTNLTKFPLNKSALGTKGQPGLYADWLFNNSDISENITVQEIDILLKTATQIYENAFAMDISLAISRAYYEYRKNRGIWALFSNKLENGQESNLSDYANNPETVCEFSESIHKIFTFNGIRFLELCSPSTRDEIFATAARFMKHPKITDYIGKMLKLYGDATNTAAQFSNYHINTKEK
ncbi:MAG: hypothetical protein LBJ18_04260 [Rickettsiales bacterium]|jgi:hypothetical protein|nr:hypothetical protein [Rickettsiales bacterium]